MRRKGCENKTRDVRQSQVRLAKGGPVLPRMYLAIERGTAERLVGWCGPIAVGVGTARAACLVMRMGSCRGACTYPRPGYLIRLGSAGGRFFNFAASASANQRSCAVRAAGICQHSWPQSSPKCTFASVVGVPAEGSGYIQRRHRSLAQQ